MEHSRPSLALWTDSLLQVVKTLRLLASYGPSSLVELNIVPPFWSAIAPRLRAPPRCARRTRPSDITRTLSAAKVRSAGSAHKKGTVARNRPRPPTEDDPFTSLDRADGRPCRSYRSSSSGGDLCDPRGGPLFSLRGSGRCPLIRLDGSRSRSRCLTLLFHGQLLLPTSKLDRTGTLRRL